MRANVCDTFPLRRPDNGTLYYRPNFNQHELETQIDQRKQESGQKNWKLPFLHLRGSLYPSLPTLTQTFQI